MKLVNFLSQSFIIFLLLLSIPKQLISQQNSTCPPNIDFELGNLNNWKPFTGSCCPINTGSAGASTGRHTIMSGTGTDPYGGFPVVPSGGGSYALKIGNNSTGAQAEKVRYFVRVPNNVNNYSFIYRYAVVFQDPGHTAAQQPRFEVKTFDSATNQSLNCNTHTYIAASNIPGFTRSNINSSVYYRAWSTATINLSGYAGRTIILDFASGDCSLNGHFGYGYVDLSCGLFQINTVACKKQKTSTLTAPPGFQSYKWLDSSKTQVLGTSSTLIVNTPSSLKKYYVVLTPFQGFGCPDTLSTQITVTNVKADFSIEPSKNLCFKGNNYTFKNNSSTNSTPMSYIWSFGDGQSSTLTSPSKSYNTADSFNIRLITSSAEGCKDTLTKGLRIYPSPVPEFNINDSLQCIRSHSFKFTNTTTLSSGSMNYNWTFGDDSSSTSNNPTKAYNSFGNYTVKLKVTSDQNCTDSTSKNVSVFEMPVARFSVNDSDQCVKNNLFSFLNNSSISSGTNSYAWNFGDNSTSNITSPNKAYDSAKNFLVRLIASSNKNCKDSAFKPVVNYAQPFAKFNINDSAQCFRSHLFSFANNSSDFDSIVYNWEFGNGDKIKTKDPNYQYNSIGFFTTKLSIVTKYGCMDSMFKNLEVCPMPISDFTMNDNNSCLKGNQFSFKNESLISDSSTLIYKWDLGDGTQSNWINLSHQYKTFGDYVINIIATSNNGCKDTVNKNISVYEHPKINFTINNKQACLLNNKFILKDITKHTSNIKNWDWIFYKANSGKDSIFNTSSMELKFNKIGKYNYQLIITDSNSCQDTIRESINVFPQSSLNFNTDTVCNGNKNTFISNNNIDTGFITELKWHFGDGLNDNKPNTTHAYKVAGRYNIMLTSTNSFGCKDTLIKYKSAQSREIPTTSFTYEKKLDSLTYTGYQFKSNSIGISNLDHFWTYNTNETSTLKNPYILFADSGMKSVKLEVKDEFGCKDETEKWIKAMPEIVVYIPNAFTPNEDGINDFFKPFGIVYNKEYEWIIINRWGELIFKSNNQMQGWNGKIKDKLVPEGVYAYLLKVTTAQNKQLKFAGTFHLIY